MKKLNVCLICRDRNILTQKTIESLRINTKLFDELSIYVFDNLSIPIENRFSIFSKLLENNIIQYYSYDTVNTLYNHFPKGIIFNRWIDMMIQESYINNDIKNYYLLIDNDIIVYKNWDSYYLESINILDHEQDIHIITQYPSGISKHNNVSYNLYNSYLDINYNVICSNNGGGSGFWFIPNLYKLLNMKWSIEHYKYIKNLYKKHDRVTWSIIKNITNNNNYLCCIKLDKPLILHIGANNSICNYITLKGNNDKYKMNMLNKFNMDESILTDMSIEDIYQLYSTIDRYYIW